ncbi:hypothetical protein CJF30_00006052 [Rutstroemia sp. NJR-2017a BBW]|nr:hypothetical protein CJF30_00006052 [Rutstroemia sp. NJR-2017a BBW]
MAETTTAPVEIVRHFAQQEQHPLSPDEIAQHSSNNDVGGSSKRLSVHDFELVRTLGTGIAESRRHEFHGCGADMALADHFTVIKLKQVDHVNHERSVLSDVAGHPFITTLITSFSDHESLYMLVSFLR